MSTPTPNDLGKVIKSGRARAVIYAVYVVAVVIIGAVQVGYASLDMGQPAWLTAALAIVGYLGAPVGALAAVNTKPKQV